MSPEWNLLRRGIAATAVAMSLAVGCASAIEPETPNSGTEQPTPGTPDAGTDEPQSSPFVDIDGDPFEAEIIALAERGLIAGMTRTEFGPEQCVSRADWAQLLSTALLLAETPCADDSPYTDVPSTAPRCPAIAAATAAGFLSGRTDGTFGPEDPLIRYEGLISVAAGAGLLPEDAGERADDPLVATHLPAAWSDIPTWARYPVAVATQRGLNVFDTKRLALEPSGCTQRNAAAGLLWTFPQTIRGGAP